MSLDVLTAIWRDPPCKGGDLLCLLAIADNADENGFAWPSMETIARKAAMSARGARKCIGNLADAGLISVEIGGGRYNSNSYQITTNGVGERSQRNNPEQSSRNRVPSKVNRNPEQNDTNPEQSCTKPGTPVPPNSHRTIKEQYCADGAQDLESLFSEFWNAYPRKGDEEKTFQEFSEAIDAGEDPQMIITAAKKYAEEQKGNKARFIKYSDNWLIEECWKRHRVKPEPTPEEQKASITRMIRSEVPAVTEEGRRQWRAYFPDEKPPSEQMEAAE